MVGVSNKTNIWRTEDAFTGDGEVDLEEENKHAEQLLSNPSADDENKKLCLEIAKEYSARNDFESARKYLEGNYLGMESGSVEEHKKLLATLQEQRTAQVNESLNRCPSQEIKLEPEDEVLSSESGPNPLLDESFISCQGEEDEGNKQVEVNDGDASGRLSSTPGTVRRLQDTIEELKNKLKEYESLKEMTPSLESDSVPSDTNGEERRAEKNEASEESEVEEVGNDDSNSGQQQAHSHNVTYNITRYYLLNPELEKWRNQQRIRENRQFSYQRCSNSRESDDCNTQGQNQNNSSGPPDVVTTPPRHSGPPSVNNAQNKNANGKCTSSTGWKYVAPEENTRTDKKSKIICDDRECCCGCGWCYVLNFL